MSLVTPRNHWGNLFDDEIHFVTVRTSMIPHTYSTHRSGKVKKGDRYTYTYLHENDIYLHVGRNFFYFFSLFFRVGKRRFFDDS